MIDPSYIFELIEGDEEELRSIIWSLEDDVAYWKEKAQHLERTLDRLRATSALVRENEELRRRLRNTAYPLNLRKVQS